MNEEKSALKLEQFHLQSKRRFFHTLMRWLRAFVAVFSTTMWMHTSRGLSNLDLVNHLRVSGVAKSPEVINALQLVDRANFAPQVPYEDTPVPVGYGQTISAPHMHACKLVLL